MSSLPNLILNRSQGELKSWQLFTHEVTKQRIEKLNLSKYHNVDNVHHSGPLMDLALEEQEGRYLLAGCNDGSIYIHDMATIQCHPNKTSNMVASVRKNSKYCHSRTVECVQWYPPDTGVFISSSMDGWVKIWDTNNMKPVEKFNFECKVHCHDMSNIANHQLLAVAKDNSHVRLIDLKSGSFIHELRSHSKSVITCKWSNNQENLLVTGNSDGKVKVWDVRHAKSCVFDLNYFRSKSNSKRSRPKGNQEKWVAHDGAVIGICFLDQGNSIITLGKDQRLRKWCLDSGHNLKAKYPKVTSAKKLQTKLSFSADCIFIPSITGIYVLDATDDNVILNAMDHHFKSSVNCCLFNHFNHELYSGGNDRNILVYDSNPSLVQDYEEHLKSLKGKSGSNECQNLSNVVTVDAWSSSEEEDF